MLNDEQKVALRVVFGGNYITADELIQETMGAVGLDSVTVETTAED